uniref:Uncharacterized protein n=1 Tax=Candidatus Kentrum sp. MB TaxID=2138164 RepID=A0A450XAW9_9GAMM|nr:MAG: hypothetical protein BECKMB1821G_GA0114241_102124 [Candidatus Kentron sp. MB]VFK30376.1 MAG: hypothetical protein BECKMB1821I_GA0114274_101524 [Candidatus Kentron sp. MB]VFK75192.1 MAG: hypothetical protein BECKMB1821H_GA0114242_101724 [Candidatus Kentron sp. MB]
MNLRKDAFPKKSLFFWIGLAIALALIALAGHAGLPTISLDSSVSFPVDI